MLQGRLFDRAVGRSHEHEVIRGIFFDRQNRGNSLIGVQWQQVYHGATLGAPTALGYRKDTKPVNLAHIGKTQERVVGVRDQ